jgi:hypothetical protein
MERGESDMPLADFVKAEPLFVRPKDAAAMLGSVELLDDVVKAGWLKAVVRRNRLTLYSVESIKHCAARLIVGEILPTKDNLKGPASPHCQFNV